MFVLLMKLNSELCKLVESLYESQKSILNRCKSRDMLSYVKLNEGPVIFFKYSEHNGSQMQTIIGFIRNMQQRAL